MLNVRLPEGLEMELAKVAKETNRSKGYYVRKALIRFLEDREDYLEAVKVLKENNDRIPYDEIRKELDLDD